MQERQTKQKQVIYDALKTLNHPTATEVYAWVHERHPTVSRATVFRVLGGFAASGRALELRLAGSEVRYDYQTFAHCHARCVNCGKVADVDVDGLSAERLQAKAHDGFLLDGFTVEFFGKCEQCGKAELSV